MQEIPSTSFLYFQHFGRIGVGGGNCVSIGGEGAGPFQASFWKVITRVGREE